MEKYYFGMHYNVTPANKLLSTCVSKPTDIIFVLDGPGVKVMQIVINSSSSLQTSPAIFMLDIRKPIDHLKRSEPQIWIYLNNDFNKAEHLSHITQDAYPNGETNTHKGKLLLFSIENIKDEKNKQPNKQTKKRSVWLDFNKFEF